MDKKSFSIEENSHISIHTIYSSIILSISSLLFGLNLCILSTFKEVFVETKKANFSMTKNQWTMAVSFIAIGALISNLCVSFIKLPRKHLMIINGIVNLGAQLIIRYSINPIMFIFGRFIVGIGAGLTTAVVPMYILLLSPPNLKSIFGSLHQLQTVVGVFIAQLFSFYFYKESNYILGMNLIVAFVLIHLILLFAVKPVRDSGSAEYKSLFQLIACKSAIKSILTIVFLHVGQQFSGIKAIIFYSSIIFKKQPNPNLCTAMIGISLIIGTVFSMFVVDKFGRKNLLILSTLGTFTFLTCLAFEKLILISIFGFFISYSLGIGPIPWFIISDIFPQEYRKAGHTIGVASNWISLYTVAMVFPVLLGISTRTGVLPFASVMFVLSCFIFLFLKETKNRKPDFL